MTAFAALLDRFEFSPEAIDDLVLPDETAEIRRCVSCGGCGKLARAYPVRFGGAWRWEWRYDPCHCVPPPSMP